MENTTSSNFRSLKDTILADWLVLDPAELAAAIPISPKRRVSPRDIADYSAANAPMLMEAFAGWFGTRTRDAGGIYAADWENFLADLRHAKQIASDPDFEIPEDGMVYRCKA